MSFKSVGIPCTARTSIGSKVRGGSSCMLRIYVRLHLLGASGMSSGGCPVNIGGRHFPIYAKLAVIIADGEGLRACYDLERC